MRSKKSQMRRPNAFEYVLLVMGVITTGLGYFLVHLVILKHGLDSFETAVSLLLWFTVIILIILTSVSENSKEELKIIINQQHNELKLLRDDIRRKR